MVGGGASHALWLPRGATLILLAPIDVKDDFALWGHLSHLTVRWVEVGDHDEGLERIEEQLSMLVEEGLARFRRLQCDDD